MVIALSAIVGITDALSMPSFQSIVPSIVAPAEVGHGLALNSTQYNLSRILGPAIAGVLISALGVMSCFAVSAASYIPFVGVALWILPRRHRARADAAAPAEPLEAAGVADILREGHLRGALITVFATALLCSPLMTFIPVLVKDTFQGGAGRFSVMLVAFGSGGLLGAAALLSLPTTINLQRVSSGCALTLGAVLAIVGLNSWIWGLPPLLVLAGASMTISNTSVNSMLQSTVRPHLLGRTVSLYMLALRGGSSLGALITGAMVSQVGVQHALFVNGVVAVGVQAVVGTYWFRADLRRPLRRPA
jgi:predicted MFS family arabinose efflux permease